MFQEKRSIYQKWCEYVLLFISHLLEGTIKHADGPSFLCFPIPSFFFSFRLKLYRETNFRKSLIFFIAESVYR